VNTFEHFSVFYGVRSFIAIFTVFEKMKVLSRK